MQLSPKGSRSVAPALYQRQQRGHRALQIVVFLISAGFFWHHTDMLMSSRERTGKRCLIWRIEWGDWWAKVYFVEGIKPYWIMCSNKRECWKEGWKLSVLWASFAKEMSDYRLQFTPLQDSPLDCSAVPGVILIQADINTRTSFITNK